jgi:hypothetical protein
MKEFNFGDKIIFNDDSVSDRWNGKGKELLYIELSGEDYIFYDPVDKDTVHIRAYYFNTYKKLKEETKTITKWEISYKKDE